MISTDNIYKKWLEKISKGHKLELPEQVDQFTKVCFEEEIVSHIYPETTENYLTLKSFPDSISLLDDKEIAEFENIQILFENNQKPSKDKILIDSSFVHNAGGSLIDEIIYAVYWGNTIVKENNASIIYFQFAIDSAFFHNIAKLRCFRFLWEYTQEEYKSKIAFNIIMQNSKREQTTLDIENNMLRNFTSLAAGILGGADKFNLLDYNALVTKGGNDLSRRQKVNSFHILKDESFLAQVKDAAMGSSTIENLSLSMIQAFQERWPKYQTLCPQEFIKSLAQKSEAIFKVRLKRIQQRNKKMIGVNIYPGSSSKVTTEFDSKSKHFPIRRLSKEYEK